MLDIKSKVRQLLPGKGPPLSDGGNVSFIFRILSRGVGLAAQQSRDVRTWSKWHRTRRCQSLRKSMIGLSQHFVHFASSFENSLD